MRRLWSGAREFLVFGGLQFVAYLNLTVNFRAIAHEQYAVAACTDGLACVLSWTIVRKIATSDASWWGKTGYVLGGSIAATVGIYLTRTWQ